MDSISLIIKSIVLGIVEGITEFLPISSTGHLIIVESLLGFSHLRTDFVTMFTYVIQLGAIGAVVELYWGKIKNSLIHFFPQEKGDKKTGLQFWWMIVLACVPGFLCILLLGKMAEAYLFNAPSVAITLFLGGIAMIFAEKKFRRPDFMEPELRVTAKQAVIIGLFQCLAIIPGMSRSASTIIGGWVAGLSTVAAAEFSFFLAIPVLTGVSLLKIAQMGGLGSLTFMEGLSLAIGFCVSFFVAMVVVKQFVHFLKEKPMVGFSIYRLVFAVIVFTAGMAGVF
jgi:undecaprenyl-diphosphatase